MNKFLKSLTMLPFLAIAGVTMLSTASAQEAVIKFNKWDGVSYGIGDESNFVRIDDQYGAENAEACENGQTVNVWMYMHNGTSPDLNGENYDGPGVAENTVISVSTDPSLGAESKTHIITGSISADNAPTVTDTVTITCGSEEVALKYNGVVKFSATQPDFKLNGDPINGAQVGFDGGRVPGCWDYRTTVVVQFEVVNEDEPEDFTLACEVLTLTKIVNKENTYGIEVVGSANPAQAANVSGGTITVAGDNYSNQPTVTVDGNSLKVAEFTFPGEGTYTVAATVDFAVADGYNTTKTSANCERDVTIDKDSEDFVLECRVLSLTEVANKEDTYLIKVEGMVDPNGAASVSGATITVTEPNGNVVTINGLEGEYTFPEGLEGDFTIEATVNFTASEGYEAEATSATCKRVVTKSIEEPPVDKPETPKEGIVTQLPRTGAGTNIALFAAVVIASSFAYRKYVASRQS